PVAIVNQKMVNEYFPGQDPIGKRLAWAREDQRIWMTIVGVVGDIRGQALSLEEVSAIYTPIAQEQRFWKTWMNFVVRADVDPANLIPRIRSEIAAIDKNIPVVQIQMMEDLIANSFVDRRFQLLLLGMFAFLAVALATVGVYGVIAYSVGCRKQEIGIRIAVGAQRADIFQWVLTQGMIVSVAGTFIGLTGVFLLTRLLRSFLFSITPTDPITLASVTCFLIFVTLAASLSPAYRASRTDPVRALKYE
ncbi:MAG TPA: FtsX-like permease family protein, partial [Acidobacteriota bacterium]|nr:FtsX-like permease family protein [Acidobacteriota bacterium]